MGEPFVSEFSTKPVTLTVLGMMCQNNCGSAVFKALSSVKGVERVDVSYPSSEANIWGTNLNMIELIEAVESIGFDCFRKADARLTVLGMMCQNSCASTVEKALVRVPGVDRALVSFQNSEALIWGHGLDTSALINTIEEVGFSCYVADSSKPPPVNSVKPVPSLMEQQPMSLPSLAKDVTTGMYLECKISGMSCAACERSIFNLISKLDGILSLKIALLLARAEIVFDSAILNKEVIISSIESLGYKVSNVICKRTIELSRKCIDFLIPRLASEHSALLSSTLGSMRGITGVFPDIRNHKLRIEYDDLLPDCVGIRDIYEAIENIGLSCSIDSKIDNIGNKSNDEVRDWFLLLCLSLVFGLPVLIIHLTMDHSEWLMMVLDVPVACSGAVSRQDLLMLTLNSVMQFVVGYKYYRSALLGAFHGNYGMDCLVVVGTSISYSYSFVNLCLSCNNGEASKHTFFEASGMLILFVTLGKFLESYAKRNTFSSIESLLKLQPTEAFLVVDHTKEKSTINTHHKMPLSYGSLETIKQIDLVLVQKNDVLKIFPGSRIPTDGYIEAGSSFVDESMITGEAVPVKRGIGDFVFGSTMNGNGILYVRVKSVGSESALSQIVKLVEAAQMDKAPVQAFADRVASLFTPIVLFLSLVTFVTWLILSYCGIVPHAWFREEYGDPVLFSMLFAISVIVISCPCALGLATPTAVMVGTAVGAQNGILIKGGAAFENAHRVKKIVFDKTGTLTSGSPTVVDIVPSGSFTREYVVTLAAGAETHSQHPLARAIVDYASGYKLEATEVTVNAVNIEGKGIIAEGKVGTVAVGNRILMNDNNIFISPQLSDVVNQIESEGKTGVYVGLNDVVVGVLGIADVLKSEAQEAVHSLLSAGIEVYMVTGDSLRVAEHFASQVGISRDRIFAGVLPQGKVDHIKRLQADGSVVAMVGDGINDAGALAVSQVGIAIGAGSHIAIEAANMVLMRNNLLDVVVALDLSRYVFSRIQLNFVWAIGYNIIAIPFAAGIWFPFTHMLVSPQYAGLAMALSSTSVVLSSLAIRFYKRPHEYREFQDGQDVKTSFSDRVLDIFSAAFRKSSQDSLGSYSLLSSHENNVELV